MKAKYVLFGLIALACTVSCKRDKVPGSGGDVIYVRVNDKALTRSADTVATPAPARELLLSVPAVLDNGDTVMVNAYLSDMEEEFLPATRGAAYTTATIGEKLGSFNTTLFKEGAVYSDEWTHLPVSDVPITYESTGNWKFGEEEIYHWPKDGSTLTFCAVAPTGLTTLSNLDWHGGESLSFGYALPEPQAAVNGAYHDAENQPDLLFAMDPQSKDSRVKASDGKHYADIQFNHALTAVRFVRGYDLDNCTIGAINLKGFYGAGTATATLTPGATVRDDRLTFTWTTTGETKTFRQTFGKTLTDADAKQLEHAQEINGASLDPSEDQSYTFMMIPQQLASGATIEIEVGERLHPLSLVLTGDDMDAKLKDWRTYAGKVITISVSSVKSGGLVDIEIGENLSGNVTSNVVVTNTPTGNNAYVRVAIITNWVNSQGHVVYPYAFEDLSGDHDHCDDFNTTDWVYVDGFYYCKPMLVSNGQTKSLFEKFTAPEPGDDAYPTGVPNIDHLQMTILVQGVNADEIDEMTKPEGRYKWPDVFIRTNNGN